MLTQLDGWIVAYDEDNRMGEIKNTNPVPFATDHRYTFEFCFRNKTLCWIGEMPEVHRPNPVPYWLEHYIAHYLV